MGVFINNKVIMKIEKEKQDELTKANMLLELAEKEMKIQKLQGQNSIIMLEVAMIKGGM